MFSAEEIIQLEKKWFKYRIKQRSKFYVITTIILLSIFFVLFKLLSNQLTIPTFFYFDNKQTQTIEKQKIKDEVLKQNINSVNDKNITAPTLPVEINTTIVENVDLQIQPTKKIDPYEFKIIPTIQPSELFSTSGSLQLHLLNESEQKNKPIETFRSTVVKKDDNTNAISPKKATITIDTIEIDNITYIKNKFYETSNITFALMLAEEYYNTMNYDESIKWALTANDINSQDDKSWYWFAKSKVKLNKNEDAIRALKAFLLNNKSNKLESLLHKIKAGDAND